MKINTIENYRITFWLLVAGFTIGTLIMTVKFGEPGLYAGLIMSSFIVIGPFLFSETLSVDIIGDQLVLKTIRFFIRKTKSMNITEIELDLDYVRRTPRGNGGFYVMRIIRNNIILHKVKHDRGTLNVFILEFNKKKEQLLTR